MESKVKLIKCGRLYDGITPEWKEHQNILIEGKCITAVGSDLTVPADAFVMKENPIRLNADWKNKLKKANRSSKERLAFGFYGIRR